MSAPTKVLPFRRPGRPPLLSLVHSDAFPRFRREWSQPGPVTQGSAPPLAVPPAAK